MSGFHVEPGVVVGGRRVWSGTVAKLSRSPPRGPTSRKIPPFFPVSAPGFFVVVMVFAFLELSGTRADNPLF